MKRRLKYGLFALALLLGVINACMYISTGISHAQKQETKAEIRKDIQARKAFFSQVISPFSSLGYEQIRTTSFGSGSVGRIIPYNYLFQLSHSNQLFALQFISANGIYAQYSAQIQIQGFYLYYLRKLLI